MDSQTIFSFLAFEPCVSFHSFPLNCELETNCSPVAVTQKYAIVLIETVKHILTSKNIPNMIETFLHEIFKNFDKRQIDIGIDILPTVQY